jgi:hypothetical protein
LIQIKPMSGRGRVVAGPLRGIASLIPVALLSVVLSRCGQVMQRQVTA